MQKFSFSERYLSIVFKDELLNVPIEQEDKKWGCVFCDVDNMK